MSKNTKKIQVRDVLDGFSKGLKPIEVAKKLGVQPNSVNAFCRRHGITQPNQYTKRPTRQSLQQLMAHKTQSEVARALGVSQSSINLWASFYGIATPAKEPAKEPAFSCSVSAIKQFEKKNIAHR